MKLPKRKYWYHATTIEAAQAIITDGTIKNYWDGVYLANTEDYASGFVRMRGHSQWAVFKIPVSRLAKDKLKVSNDHARMFFPKDLVCAVYDESISVTINDVECYETC